MFTGDLATYVTHVAVCVVWGCVALYALVCGVQALWRRRKARAQARRIAAEISTTVAAIHDRATEPTD